MATFEAIAALAGALAVAIPTFMDKVMRPKYEELFTRFRKARMDSFIDELEKTLEQLKQTKEALNPETAEAMQSLFNEWGQIKTDENKLTTLLKYRKFFFVGWFVSCTFSLFSVEYSEVLIPLLQDMPLGRVTLFIFICMLFATFWYGIELFNLDEKLSKFGAEKTGEIFGEIESTRKSMKVALTEHVIAENTVEKTLTKFSIPFEKNAIFKSKNGVAVVSDYAIPSSKKPKYLIEIKVAPLMDSIYRTSNMYNEIKSETSAKTIFISNFEGKPQSVLKVAEAYWDYVIDFHDLERVKEIIKL
jgi:hypothetical protein